MPIVFNTHRRCISKSIATETLVAATSNVAGEESAVTGLTISRIQFCGNVVISRQGGNTEFILNGAGEIDCEGVGDLLPAANIVITMGTTLSTCILHLYKRY